LVGREFWFKEVIYIGIDLELQAMFSIEESLVYREFGLEGFHCRCLYLL